MDVRFSNAAQAYSKAIPGSKTGGEQLSAKQSDGSFADLVTNAAHNAVNTLNKGEQASMKAVTGEANLTDVVTAVTQAEVTLQTVMSIRDTLVESYQRIMQMPI